MLLRVLTNLVLIAHVAATLAACGETFEQRSKREELASRNRSAAKRRNAHR